MSIIQRFATENYVDEKIAAVGPPSGGGLPSGGAPHQMLVTDADGKTVWEDRTHYSRSHTIRWDGIIGDREKIDEGDSTYLVRLGDVPDIKWFFDNPSNQGYVVTNFDGERLLTELYPYYCEIIDEEGSFVFSTDGVYTLVVMKDGFVMPDGSTTLRSGVYISCQVEPFPIYVEEIVFNANKQIDSSFLQNSFTRDTFVYHTPSIYELELEWSLDTTIEDSLIENGMTYYKVSDVCEPFECVDSVYTKIMDRGHTSIGNESDYLQAGEGCYRAGSTIVVTEINSAGYCRLPLEGQTELNAIKVTSTGTYFYTASTGFHTAYAKYKFMDSKRDNLLKLRSMNGNEYYLTVSNEG